MLHGGPCQPQLGFVEFLVRNKKVQWIEWSRHTFMMEFMWLAPSCRENRAEGRSNPRLWHVHDTLGKERGAPSIWGWTFLSFPLCWPHVPLHVSSDAANFFNPDLESSTCYQRRCKAWSQWHPACIIKWRHVDHEQYVQWTIKNELTPKTV